MLNQNQPVPKDVVIGQFGNIFELSQENLEFFREKSDSFLKQPILINATTQEIPQVQLPGNNQNQVARHLILYLDSNIYPGLDPLADLDAAMPNANANRGNNQIERMNQIKLNLRAAVTFYNPQGYVFLMTRDQEAASAFAAVAHQCKFTICQLEPPGFRTLDEMTDEKSRIQTMLARLQNVVKLRGSNQLRTVARVENNVAIQLTDIR